MKPRRISMIVSMWVFSVWYAAMDAAGAYTLSRGRQILLDRGLQIQSLVMPQQGPNIPTPGITDLNRWLQANFTTIDFWQSWNFYNQPLLAQLPAGTQWTRSSAQSATLYQNELPYLNRLVNLKYLDEQEQTQAVLDAEKAQFAAWKVAYPNTIAHTNFSYHQLNAAQLAAYMLYTEPDMIQFDFYPSFFFSTPPDPASRETWYSTMQLYRTAGLAGIDGTGATPIPYAQFLANYRSNYAALLPSESFIRLQHNASWAFGYTFIDAFVYNEWALGANSVPVMFDSAGDSAPNAVFNYVAETNRQSQNLGPALVRLVSSGIFMTPGSSRSLTGTGLSQWTAHAGNTTGYTDYLTSITPTVSQGGATDTTYDDILVGYFKPLLSDTGGATFADGLHFMIVNGAAGTPGTATVAGSTAAESAQWYHLTFDFTGSTFNSLVRLSRDTGQVELVPLTHLTGSQYSLDLNLPGGTGDLFAFWNSSIPLPTLLPVLGDFDGDGDVDGADFVVWQTHFPTASGATLATGDADGDGDVDGADFVVWQTHFPTTSSGGAVSAVPEPNSMIVAALGVLGLVGAAGARGSRQEPLRSSPPSLAHAASISALVLGMAKAIIQKGKKSMIRRQVLTIVGICAFSVWYATVNTASGVDLSRGRQILLNRGLQIQSLVMPQQGPNIPTPGITDVNRWLQANFTTIDFWQSPLVYNQPLLTQLPAGKQWTRSSAPSATLSPDELPYLDRFVDFKYLDEQEQTQAVLDAEKAQFAAWKVAYPDAIAHTNFSYHQLDAAQLASFMKYTKPDMIQFDFYPSFFFSTPPDPASRETWYSTMQLYRTAGLAGIDGSGEKPIPYAQFLTTYRSNYTAILPSESFIRLQQNASWAFGYTFVNAFVYNEWGLGVNNEPVMFDSAGDSAPNTVFNYVAETNRQSQNLGPALVRLVSSGIFMTPGSSRSLTGTGLSQWTANAGNTTGYTDYLTSITPTVSQGGAADTTYDDILVGYFKPLLEDNSGATFADGLHFMLVNGAAGTPGTGTVAGSTAAASAQWYHLTFDFTGSTFNSLVRLSRDTGQVELVPLTHLIGSQYSLDLNLPGGTGDLFAFWNSSNPLPTISGNPGASISEPNSMIVATLGVLGLVGAAGARGKRTGGVL